MGCHGSASSVEVDHAQLEHNQVEHEEGDSQESGCVTFARDRNHVDAVDQFGAHVFAVLLLSLWVVVSACPSIRAAFFSEDSAVGRALSLIVATFG